MKAIGRDILESLARQASQSPRRRQHLNLHATPADPCQRFINFLWRDSYIRPHRHMADPKPETLVALQGMFGCIVFDEQGGIVRLERLAAGRFCPVIVIEPAEWHTVVALTETAALLETQAGPFNPAAAKEYAPWATEERAQDAAGYLNRLHALFD